MTYVAVVEDSPDNRLLMRLYLGGRYRVRTFGNGPSFLASLEADPPDIVLLDISLPGMDGIEVQRRVRARADSKDLPIVALTAHAMAGDRERFLAAGFDDYVAKPIEDETVLFETLDRWLR